MTMSPTGTVQATPGTDERMQVLYETYASPLLRFLMPLTLGQREIAEDLMQETMLRAWQHLDTLAPDPARLRSWLFTVARRVAIDNARARRARPQEVGNYDVADVPAAVEDVMDTVLTEQVVREAVAKLSAIHRAVLIEIYFRSRTPAEVAATLGIPEGTVKSRTYYALRVLRRAIGKNSS